MVTVNLGKTHRKYDHFADKKKKQMTALALSYQPGGAKQLNKAGWDTKRESGQEQEIMGEGREVSAEEEGKD
jgi:hypothetical protein